MLPGGFGAAKNLSNFGSEGPKMEVTENVKKIVTAFHNANKPIASCCIAPVIIARLFPKVHVTLGQEKVCDENPFADACGAVKVMGAVHVPCNATEVCVDKEMKIVSTPAYMRNSPIHVVHDGIDNMIKALFELLYSCFFYMSYHFWKWGKFLVFAIYYVTITVNYKMLLMIWPFIRPFLPFVYLSLCINTRFTYRRKWKH